MKNGVSGTMYSSYSPPHTQSQKKPAEAAFPLHKAMNVKKMKTIFFFMKKKLKIETGLICVKNKHHNEFQGEKGQFLVKNQDFMIGVTF